MHTKEKPKTNQQGEERSCLKDPWCVTCLAVYKLCVLMFNDDDPAFCRISFFFSSFAF